MSDEDSKLEKEKEREKQRLELRDQEYKALHEAIQSTILRANDAVARLQKVEKQLNLTPNSELSDVVRYYDYILSESLQSLYTSFSELVDDHILPLLLQLIINILLGTREVLVLSGSCKNVENNAYENFLSPINNNLADIANLCVKYASHPNNCLHLAIKEGSKAFAWISNNSPLMQLTQIRSSFAQLCKTDPLLNPFENQTTAFFNLLCKLEGYLEITHKSRISFTGEQELPAYLRWKFNGIQIINFPLEKKVTSHPDYKIVANISNGKEETVDALDQHVIILQSRECEINITGTPASVSIENCSFTSVNTPENTPIIDISNSQFVQVRTSGKVNAINLERCHSCVLDLQETQTYHITSNAVVALKILKSNKEEYHHLTPVVKYTFNGQNFVSVDNCK